MKTALHHLQEKKPYVSNNYIVGVSNDGTASMYQLPSGRLVGVHSALGMHLLTEFTIDQFASSQGLVCTPYNNTWLSVAL